MTMKKSGAWLVRYALEQLPVSHTFGIPGVHNTEIYDELNRSELITPILVTHEMNAAFIADAVSRTSLDGKIGVLIIVPAAGITHAMSGIGEAFLDGIPMLVISGGVRTDVKFGYQLHELDQCRLVSEVTKGAYRVLKHDEIIATVFKAYELATSGTPGPVFVEIPANLQLFQGEVETLPRYTESNTNKVKTVAKTNLYNSELFNQAARMLSTSLNPGIFVGWGAVDVIDDVVQIAEKLGAPVATTLQGVSAFPGNHPLHVGMGFSRAAVPAAEKAFKNCDCLLAIGTRFGEIPTGSFSCVVPDNLIHLDINKEVFNRNFQTKIAIEGDSRETVPSLRVALESLGVVVDASRKNETESQISLDKAAYFKEWSDHARSNDRVNPAFFFKELRNQLKDTAVLCVDDGNHTFLAAELFEARGRRRFISPTDFNAMGYCVPATIGAKLSNPTDQVVGIVGDGAFLMSGLELLTGTTEGLGVAIFVFSDGELSQISQGQEIPYNRKTCTILGDIRLEGIAIATGAKYLTLLSNDEIKTRISEALQHSHSGQPVIVDVKIDYSKRTRFTQGVVHAVLKRFPLGDKFRFIGRALVRKVTG